MKKIALAAALSLAATSSFAGNIVEPVMEPEVIVEETGGTAGGIVVPLLLLAVVAAIAASNH
ncbi:hypothetical protein [Roseitranquillus sediminis]|uniref:hypothetical protein n=1 Tax=Roseitranquillus sediminis TaxID=2809051 RepID=UPI001D0C6266|nr:hypothetical protein [Roseitranquillus sediminis]MBM9593823.1 hypothetical protein [Roseitranquillus sediminis]